MSNALPPLSLLTCSVKTRNALCNELPLYNFLALCTMLKTTHGINSTGSPFSSKLPEKRRTARHRRSMKMRQIAYASLHNEMKTILL